MRQIIFTRHALTSQQYELLTNPVKSGLAEKTLETGTDAEQVIQEWIALAGDSRTIEIYGVIPPILRAKLYEKTCESQDRLNNGKIVHGLRFISVYESHNINRAPEGERPNFSFVRWVLTGIYEIEDTKKESYEYTT